MEGSCDGRRLEMYRVERVSNLRRDVSIGEAGSNLIKKLEAVLVSNDTMLQDGEDETIHILSKPLCNSMGLPKCFVKSCNAHRVGYRMPVPDNLL